MLRELRRNISAGRTIDATTAPARGSTDRAAWLMLSHRARDNGRRFYYPALGGNIETTRICYERPHLAYRGRADVACELT